MNQNIIKQRIVKYISLLIIFAILCTIIITICIFRYIFNERNTTYSNINSNNIYIYK